LKETTRELDRFFRHTTNTVGQKRGQSQEQFAGRRPLNGKSECFKGDLGRVHCDFGNDHPRLCGAKGGNAEVGLRGDARLDQNTAQHALFLPTSREAKYKAQAATETFFWRAGDVTQAGLVYLGVSLGLELTAFTKINLALTLVWLGVAAMLYHEHRRLTQEK
jgi:hypothetical protein